MHFELGHILAVYTIIVSIVIAIITIVTTQYNASVMVKPKLVLTRKFFDSEKKITLKNIGLGPAIIIYATFKKNDLVKDNIKSLFDDFHRKHKGDIRPK